MDPESPISPKFAARRKGLRFITALTTGILLAAITALSGSCSKDDRAKRVLYVNSYHDGYPSSDSIREGILEVLEREFVRLRTVYLDSKRKPGRIRARTRRAIVRFRMFSPDVVIVSDDNAVKHLVVPKLQYKGVPIVFCGVNWSAERYDLNQNVTGMLELMPLRECIGVMQHYNPDIGRLAVLSENSIPEQRNKEILDTLFRNLGLDVRYHLVDDFEQWKNAFIKASRTSDLIYMPANGAIRNWDRQAAMRFVEDRLSVPTITCNDFMMDYCVFGLVKVAREQGEWAARTALRILDGAHPAEIPVTRNDRFRPYLNQSLADKVGFSTTFTSPASLL